MKYYLLNIVLFIILCIVSIVFMIVALELAVQFGSDKVCFRKTATIIPEARYLVKSPITNEQFYIFSGQNLIDLQDRPEYKEMDIYRLK